VTQKNPWPQNSEWFDDARAERRWPDALTLVARVGQAECLGKTRDVSMGGLGAVLLGLQAAPGDAIEMDVLFDGEARQFRGEVMHAASCPEGNRVGIRFQPPDTALRKFLEVRYRDPFRGLGSVT